MWDSKDSKDYEYYSKAHYIKFLKVLSFLFFLHLNKNSGNMTVSGLLNLLMIPYSHLSKKDNLILCPLKS